MVVMRLASHRDVWFKAALFQRGDVGRAEVAGSKAPAGGVPNASGRVSKVGTTSAWSLAWLESEYATINKLS
jgi:hypothetical protein